MRRVILMARSRGPVVGAAVALLLILSARPQSQEQYTHGQNVAPVYEGWEPNADGTFTMYFGYMNRNYEELVEVPIGPNNSFEPDGPDRGQPTHFYPRRQMLIFSVTVPADWGEKKDLIWTLTSKGKTEKAYGSLWTVWKIGDSLMGSFRGGNSRDETNQGPTIKLLTPAAATVKVGEPVNLAAEVTDDGKPGTPARKPPPPPPVGPIFQSPISQMVIKREPGAVLGVTWVQYRGAPGGATFSPMSVAVVKGRAASQVRFGRPGTYVVRAYADDGVRTSTADVTVTVTP